MKNHNYDQPFHSISNLIELKRSLPTLRRIYGPITEFSTGLIVGPPKIGKTRLSEQLGYDIAAGKSEFLNVEIEHPEMKVALALLEENYTKRLNRHIDLFNTYSNEEKEKIEQNLKIIGDYPSYLTSNDLRTHFKNSVKEIAPDLLIIDSLSHLTSDNISETKPAKEVMRWLQELTEELEITTIVIHHVTKLYETEFPTMDNIKGSTEIVQESDYAIGVGKVNGKRAVKPIFSRYTEEDDNFRLFDISTNGVLIHIGSGTEQQLRKSNDGRRDDTRKIELVNCIQEISSKSEDGLAQRKNIIEAVNYNDRRVDELLNQLLEKSKIQRVAKGKYKLISTE